eukprot:4349369-Heterocapsa_arctica.AAC.1
MSRPVDLWCGPQRKSTGLLIFVLRALGAFWAPGARVAIPTRQQWLVLLVVAARPVQNGRQAVRHGGRAPGTTAGGL